MKKNVDIIMLALPRWDGDYSSTAFSFAKEFSKHHRVFYIDNPFTFKDFISLYADRRIKKRTKALLFGKHIFTLIQKNLIAVTPRLVIPINFLSGGNLYNFFAKINDRILFKCLKQIIVNYQVENFIFINSFNPFYLKSFPDGFKPKLYIYQTVDDIHHSKYIKRHGPRLEKLAMQSADIVLTTSTHLLKLNQHLSKEIFHIPNAAEFTLFKPKENLPRRPLEFEKIDKPIIIYIGNIDGRVEFDLLHAICKANPEKMLVMVGPISVPDSMINPLKEYPNLLLTGKKQLEELPAYLHHAACAVIPFKQNSLTKSIYPLKINEYLAAGKPVVSTPFSDDIILFNEVIDVASDPKVFLDYINKAISQDTLELSNARIKAANGNTWEARISKFWNIIDDYCVRHQVEG